MTLIPREFSFATPDDLGKEGYVQFCEKTGLMPVPEGYGFLHVEDADGNRSTVVPRDVEYARILSEAEPHAIGGPVAAGRGHLGGRWGIVGQA